MENSPKNIRDLIHGLGLITFDWNYIAERYMNMTGVDDFDMDLPDLNVLEIWLKLKTEIKVILKDADVREKFYTNLLDICEQLKAGSAQDQEKQYDVLEIPICNIAYMIDDEDVFKRFNAVSDEIAEEYPSLNFEEDDVFYHHYRKYFYVFIAILFYNLEILPAIQTCIDNL